MHLPHTSCTERMEKGTPQKKTVYRVSLTLVKKDSLEEVGDGGAGGRGTRRPENPQVGAYRREVSLEVQRGCLMEQLKEVEEESEDFCSSHSYTRTFRTFSTGQLELRRLNTTRKHHLQRDFQDATTSPLAEQGRETPENMSPQSQEDHLGGGQGENQGGGQEGGQGENQGGGQGENQGGGQEGGQGENQGGGQEGGQGENQGENQGGGQEGGQGENQGGGQGENQEVGQGENQEVGQGQNQEVGQGENQEVGQGEIQWEKGSQGENQKRGQGENQERGQGENQEGGQRGCKGEMGGQGENQGENQEVGQGENQEVGQGEIQGENQERGQGENQEGGQGGCNGEMGGQGENQEGGQGENQGENQGEKGGQGENQGAGQGENQGEKGGQGGNQGAGQGETQGETQDADRLKDDICPAGNRENSRCNERKRLLKAKSMEERSSELPPLNGHGELSTAKSNEKAAKVSPETPLKSLCRSFSFSFRHWTGSELLRLRMLSKDKQHSSSGCMGRDAGDSSSSKRDDAAVLQNLPVRHAGPPREKSRTLEVGAIMNKTDSMSELSRWERARGGKNRTLDNSDLQRLAAEKDGSGGGGFPLWGGGGRSSGHESRLVRFFSGIFSGRDGASSSTPVGSPSTNRSLRRSKRRVLSQSSTESVNTDGKEALASGYIHLDLSHLQVPPFI